MARHEFRKSPPGKAGFCIFRSLLGGRPPLFDQLQKGLASAAQTLALLEIVEHRDRLTRQLHKNLLAPGGTDALAVTFALVDWGVRVRHQIPDSVSRNPVSV
jgi:hypothetical protein